MEEYRLTVGLEVHAELNTLSKMFCACRNDPDEKRPNLNICPVCMAHPGALPVINEAAVRSVLLVGVALGSELASGYTEFDRKNYFYPDIPKGYQISQYQYPLVRGGSLNGVAITRVHLEEDTARSQHTSLISDLGEQSLVDFNRSGVPLMELVTEPHMHSAKAVGDFARELQLLLRYLGVSEANMEKGQMRVEANISVSRDGTLGHKVEVKNLNSFRSMERAIAYEYERQIARLSDGGEVVQETRGWDEAKQATFSQRVKESAEDYRYFPEPDLPKLVLSGIPMFSNESLKKELPELPWQKRGRLQQMGFLQTQDIEQLIGDFELAAFFARAEDELKDQVLLKIAANFILNDIAGKRKNNPMWLPPLNVFVSVVRKYHAGELHAPQAKNSILNGVIIETVSDGALPEVVIKVIQANPEVVLEYKAGKVAVLQFLVGQGMKESKGSANPQALRKEFEKNLAS
jgi:aspartyl-tRNA(Asn)/glutamyl-tRNA(Gln) amidotransferase subunit B